MKDLLPNKGQHPSAWGERNPHTDGKRVLLYMRLESNERGGALLNEAQKAQKESILVRNKSDMSVGMLAVMARRQRGWRLMRNAMV